MTQFVLCRQTQLFDMGKKVKRVSIEDDNLISEVASKNFSGSHGKNIFTISFDDKSFDSVCTAAQIDLADGKDFSETCLFECINVLMNTCNELVFWYGGDYDDLDCIYDKQGLLKKVEEALADSSCELYAYYKEQE